MKPLYRLLLSATLLLGCALAGDEPTDTDIFALSHEATTPDELHRFAAEPFREPFRVEIEACLGYTARDIMQATDTARIESVSSCLLDRGHGATHEDLERLVVADPHATTTAIDIAIETVTQGQTDVERLGIPEPLLITCLEEAEFRINPALALSDFLEEATDEISDRLKSDPAIVAAYEQQTACIQQSGFNGDMIDQYNQEETAASSIAFHFLAGELSQAVALTGLEQLKAQRAARQPTAVAVERCVEERLAVERQLVIEQQEAYLAANPGWIEQITDSYRAVITPITQ